MWKQITAWQVYWKCGQTAFGGEDELIWLSSEDLKGETGNEIIAGQDQALQTEYHVKKILQTESENKFRL